MQNVSVPALLSLCLDVSRRAGGIIRHVANSGDDMGLVDKQDGVTVPGMTGPLPTRIKINDPQTVADRRAQALIVNTLRHFYPDLAIVGEEDASVSTHDPTYAPLHRIAQGELRTPRTDSP